MASEDVKTCQNLAAKAKRLAKTLTKSMAGHAELTSVHCVDVLLATQGDLEIVFEGVVEITDQAHDQLNHVAERLRQDVTDLEQQVTTYSCKQGEIVPPLCVIASVSCDARVGTLSHRCTQTTRENADVAEDHCFVQVKAYVEADVSED